MNNKKPLPRIAIHKSSSFYSQKWIEYCENSKLQYKVVNCHSNTIIADMENCDILMWHHNHGDPVDAIVAKQILFALEHAGKVVFPDFKSGWHFDDKLGQKYLFESLKLPAVKTFAFFQKDKAKKWLENRKEYPLVFKLRRGSGSRNVKLLKSPQEGRKIVDKAFGKGFRQYDPYGGTVDAWKKLKKGKAEVVDVLKASAHIVYPLNLERSLGRERGYVYFQEFIPNCDCDYRTKIVGNKLWGYRRMVRENDFRASGSKEFFFAKEAIPKDLVSLSFEIYKKIGCQHIALDFVEHQETFLLVEVSYGSGVEPKQFQSGYWDDRLNWHEGDFNPFGWMIEDAITDYSDKTPG